MNKKRILALAAHLESIKDGDPVGFNMDFYHFNRRELSDPTIAPDRSGHNCGTIACIAGHAALLWKGRPSENEHVNAAVALDLDAGIAGQLFCPIGWGSEVWRSTPKQAAKVLRHLAATGEVDWRKAK